MNGLLYKSLTATMSPSAALSVVELRGDPGQSPLQVGEHELERLGPLLLRVELGFNGVRSAATTRVFDFALLNVHPGEKRGVEEMTLILVSVATSISLENQRNSSKGQFIGVFPCVGGVSGEKLDKVKVK